MTTHTDFEPLSPAEMHLLRTCSGPERVVLADGGLPENAGPNCTIRAALLRELVLGSLDISLNPKGLRLRGAWISGPLDLQGTDCERDITLGHCMLDGALNLVNAHLRGLHLMGCQTQGIAADNASFTGSLYIRGETTISGEVALAGTRISGDLQMCGVVIKSKDQDAVFAPSLRVEGSIFLGNYPYSNGVTTLMTEGMLFFSSAHIAHDFFISHTSIALPSDPMSDGIFSAAEEHGHNIALSLARTQVGGILYLQNNQIAKGILNLAGAVVARLGDEPAGPGANYDIRLDGFRYADFSRHTDTSPNARLDWLARRPGDLPFTAQPYEQLATVLTTMGHRTDAQTVLMRKEQLLRSENRRLFAISSGSRLRSSIMHVGDMLMRVSIGYGYRPGRAVAFAVLLIGGLGLFYQKVWNDGDMAPNAAPILVSRDWIAATQTHPDHPAQYWSSTGQAGQDYETFQSVAYAADLVIPLVSFGQEEAWAPSTARGPMGRIGWWLRWVAKLLGWIVTALAAAALTGVIRKD
ncbi:hypothetical protein [Actibacterium sp. 188UL27-1]|uniref:hypothetical protein n=1 Tax=Actibacterium sp. 188UL27-1 TaxID=2786961 RepID=UPI00195611D1|nr:hypothetical protein [Actibacterium sp. 188UL27-1]MBM7069119.1 hypothetical protein [Actibacterium sp. 188UL27-1]